MLKAETNGELEPPLEEEKKSRSTNETLGSIYLINHLDGFEYETVGKKS